MSPQSAFLPLFALCLGSLSIAVQADGQMPTAASEGLSRAGQHSAVFTTPPTHVPCDKMVDGPLLGNGDAAVVMAGPPEEMRFFLGKNDFWGRLLPGETLTPEELAAGSTKFAHTKGGGRLTISIPALRGASYRLEQSLAEAEVRGLFTKDALTLRSRSRVDANRNLLITEWTAEGGEAELFFGQSLAGAGDTKIRDSGKPANLGREQLGGGRWYFLGETAGMAIANQALDLAAIRRAAAVPPATGERFDGKTTWRPLEAPPIGDSLTVSGWIKLDEKVEDNGVYYLVSKGEWNEAYSLGITTQRRLRWSLNGQIMETQPLATGRWYHVAGVASPRWTALCLNGEPVVQRSSDGHTWSQDGVLCGYRDGDPLPGARRIAWATRCLGTTTGDGTRTRLIPGHPLTIATAISSDLDAKDPVADAEAQVRALTPASLAELAQAHRAWWANFWGQSFIDIPDQVLEQHWYAALYTLASCSRENKIPPGLWGWSTADTSAWCGSYTLNYNYEAPYFIAGPSNHPELVRNYFRPVLEFIPKSRELAKQRGFKGIYFPTGIAPWGWHYGEKNHDDQYPAYADFAQRSNAAYLAVNFISYWQLTQDEGMLRDILYPFLRGVAEFWEDYLKLENNRYVILHDAIHEEGYCQLTHPISQDMNSIVSLALVRQLFRELIPMSETLGVDADKRAQWRDIVARLSPFATQQRNGKTVFRYTERGRDWNGDNTLGIQHIYPGNGIGLDSDPRLLDISRNTIDAMARWDDNNGTSTWYTACARVGYDPATILARLRRECDTHSYPNQVLHYGGGGMENLGVFLALNEMLMQSHEGVIRFFPCWPKDLDAKFGTLRARGAFLVSADLKGGIACGVKILSEKGKDCTVQNPWPGQKVQVIRHGRLAETAAGDRFTIKTKIGETLELKPE